MKKIEKIISRDLPIIGMHADHVGLTSGIRDWLGWAYSDLIFYFHDNYADLVMVPGEHYEEFLQETLKKIETDATWFETKYEEFLGLTQKFQQFFDDSRAKLSGEVERGDLSKIYQDFYSWMNQYYGLFVLMKWFPIWLEDEQKLKSKYAKEINSGIDARKKAEKILPQGREITNLLLDRLSKEVPFDRSLLHFLTLDEFNNFLKNGEFPKEQDLKKRQKGFIFSSHGIHLTEGNQKKAKEILAGFGYDFDIEDFSNVTEIKGQIACPGRVKGKVRLIMTKNKIASVREGEILVTSMTTPEYLPAMKKAAAFVTDEGGITCHAAIVAREMEKPCIIGTKNATKVLKDGDMVEVDADNGIVRKL